MWNWILKIADLIRALLSQKAELSKKQEEENRALEEQRKEIEAKVDAKYDQEEKDIPNSGAELVDYWSNRGVHSSSPDSTPSTGSGKGGTNSK
jgi:single-stranded DNA-specific DHH superfamily exonuclease